MGGLGIVNAHKDIMRPRTTDPSVYARVFARLPHPLRLFSPVGLELTLEQTWINISKAAAVCVAGSSETSPPTSSRESLVFCSRSTGKHGYTMGVNPQQRPRSY
ncbi:hypothetical protein ElyMa_004628800 [Elysia marginata]|uniref:Uncharacterized protein n=1 Tax=Elysia marginata TaxID=1093978 RepID=A0AAV4HYP9_9GAST|nr:hypothetical protein ElyMa_004628800 [Elysia marginata]